MSQFKKAMFGAGCFWGTQTDFDEISGVETEVGYSGGDFDNPTYEDVCLDKTGHAEVVLVKYDLKKVSYKKLLDVFWKTHDPTTLNRQEADIGSQYRSVIFYFDDEQKKLAQKSKERLNKEKYHGKIVTEILPAKKFWRAEEYHQKYLEKKGSNVCH
jgi:peptide-methionine (S)-S-oxide reductase